MMPKTRSAAHNHPARFARRASLLEAIVADKRPSIYVNPPIQRVRESLRENQSLSARLGEICERYELICKHPPELSDDERNILGNTLSGSVIEPLLIRHLEDELEDSDAGDPSAIRDLAARVRDMSMAERVALIENLGF